MTSETRRQIDALERTRPDPQNDPAGYRSITEEITRLIDLDRAWAYVPGRKVA